MVKRVCERAGIRALSPHPLRHGFANRFLRESDRDLASLQAMLGHSRPDTTQAYTDDLELDDLARALSELAEQTLKYPRNRVMEAAGIEPASAAAPAEHLQA
jgi:site-specific recombinase XerD